MVKEGCDKMQNNIDFPEDMPDNTECFEKLETDIINMLSENEFTISQSR